MDFSCIDAEILSENILFKIISTWKKPFKSKSLQILQRHLCNHNFTIYISSKHHNLYDTVDTLILAKTIRAHVK